MGHANDIQAGAPPSSLLEDHTLRSESNNLGLSNSTGMMDQLNTIDTNIIKLMDNGEMDLSSQALMHHQQPIGRISMKNCDRVRIGPEYKIKAENITIIGNLGKLDAHNIPSFINQKTKSLATIPEETNSDIITDIESVKPQTKSKRNNLFQNMKKRTKIILLVSFTITLILAIAIPLTLILSNNKKTNSNNSTTMSPTTPATQRPPVDFFISVKEWSSVNNKIDGTYQNYTKNRLGIDNFNGADYCNDKPSCIKVLKDMQKKSKHGTKYNLNYNYLIGGDGRVYESRGNYCEADYNNDYSIHFIKIGFIGDYSNTTINSLQDKALNKIIDTLIDKCMLDKDYTLVPQCCRNIPGDKGPGDNIIQFLFENNYFTDHPMKVSCGCANFNTGTTTESPWWWPLI